MQAKRTLPSLLIGLAALLPLALPAHAGAATPTVQQVVYNLRQQVNSASQPMFVNACGNLICYQFRTISASCSSVNDDTRVARGPLAFSDWMPGHLTPEEIYSLVRSGAPLPGKKTAFGPGSSVLKEGQNWKVVLLYTRPGSGEQAEHTLILDSQYRVLSSTLREKSYDANGNASSKPVARWHIKHTWSDQTTGLFRVPSSSAGYFVAYGDTSKTDFSVNWENIRILNTDEVSKLTQQCTAARK